MVDTDQGLTKTHNALKDPDATDPRILELRRLHEAMDRAVLDAYGWTDLVVPPYCPRDDAERAQLAAFEDEVIDRLYALNAVRAREEQIAGVGGKKGKGTAKNVAALAPTSAADSVEPSEAAEATSDTSGRRRRSARSKATAEARADEVSGATQRGLFGDDE